MKQINLLPPGVLKSDVAYPGHDKVVRDAGDYGALTFYLVQGRKGTDYWCISTLGISKGRSGRAARTYAVRVDDGMLVRVGNGPHVLQTVTIYLSKARLTKLQRYVDLYQKGACDAGMVRDRISSRRAEGQLRRARGESYWTWSN